MKVKTLKGIVQDNVAKYGKETAFQIKKGSGYYHLTYEDVGRYVKNIMKFFEKEGIQKGDHIAVLSENRPEWPATYLAVASYGAVNIPLDALLTQDHLHYLLKDSGAKILITSQKFIEVIQKIRNYLPGLKTVVCMDYDQTRDGILSFSQIADQAPDPNIKYPDNRVDGEDLLAIIYTSGTTGTPKGVMLTHANIFSNLSVAAMLFKIDPSDTFLSVLPIHHTFECTGGFLAAYYMGARVHYCESLKSNKLLADMQEQKVTVMLAVPLLYQLFYEGIERQMDEKGKMMKLIFNLLLKVSAFSRKMFQKDIGRKLFGSFHKKIGGNTRFWVSGGAAIDPRILENFGSMGLTILQGYGLTETSPLISITTLEDNKVGSVGKPINGVEVKIDKPDNEGRGEIICRGPNVMKGYYKNPGATAEVIKDGWFHTGDIGYLDEEGNLYISGRLKDIIVTGAGRNVSPEEVEFALITSPFIKEVCAIGRRVEKGARIGVEEVFAVIVPSEEYFQNYCAEKKIQLTDEFIHETLKEEIFRKNQQMEEYKRVMDFAISKEDLPKTSTRKVRRFEVRKKYFGI